MTTTLYLIRHGETDWNAMRRWQGHADIPLNDKGLMQARLVAQRLKHEQVHFDAIYSSDLARAFQTAWEIGAALKVAVQLLPPLREIDTGAWSGLTREEISERYPVEYRLLEEGQDIPRGGGETLFALRGRVVETVDAMVAQHPGETLALVMHGGSIRALLTHVNELSGLDVAYNQHIGNTAITILRCEVGRWQVETFNDVSHLEGMEEELHLVTSPPDDTEQPWE